MRPLRRPLEQQRLRIKPEPEIVRHFIRIANREPGSDSILPATLAQAAEWLSLMAVPPAIQQDEPEDDWWRDIFSGSLLPAGRGEPKRAELLRFRRRWRAAQATTIRFILTNVADQNAAGYSLERVYRFFSPQMLSLFSLRMVKSDNGAMRAVVEPLEPLKLFLEKVDLNRIKRCAYEKCRKIFWAGRIDRPCCSELCRNAYRQKRHREREKQNRPYKKRLLEKRSTRNE